MSRLHCTALLTVSALLTAQDNQDPLAAAQPKLQKSLAAMAALPNCGFAASWGPDEIEKKKAEKNDGGFMLSMLGGSAGDAKGAWASDRLHLQFADDELLLDGRRMLARGGEGEWNVRQGRFHDGAPVSFTPDPQALFAQLMRMDLAVTNRSAGSLDDRPVDVYGATLSQDQVAQLVWSGAVPPLAGGFGGQMVMLAAGPGAQPRQTPPTPDATVDVAFYVEPGTGQVHRVHLRSHQKQDGPGMVFGGGGGRVMRVIAAQGAGGVQVLGGGGNDDDEEDDKDSKPEAADNKPLVYENGLPQRPRKKVMVTEYTINLRDFGTAKLPELDDKTKALLGR